MDKIYIHIKTIIVSRLIHGYSKRNVDGCKSDSDKYPHILHVVDNRITTNET